MQNYSYSIFFFCWFKLFEPYPELFLGCSFEDSVIYKDFLENFQNLQEGTFVRGSFILRSFFEPANLLKSNSSSSPKQNCYWKLLLKVLSVLFLKKCTKKSLKSHKTFCLLQIYLLLLLLLSLLFNIWNRSKTISHTKMDYLNLEKNI